MKFKGSRKLSESNFSQQKLESIDMARHWKTPK